MEEQAIEPAELQQFDVVQAEFRPTRTDTLKPGAVQMIGRTGEWQALWVIEEGPYEGQWAMQAQGKLLEECIHSGSALGESFAWVPSGDLLIKG